MPVDYVEIDGLFVRHLVDSINPLGHAMALKTIAEFVESEDILDPLRTLGVD